MSQVETVGWGAREPTRTRSPRSVRFVIGTLIVIAALVLVWLTLKWEATPEVQQLPERERHEVLRRVLEDLRLCATKSGELIPEHCQHQAKLAQEFVECDAACRALASGWDHRPTR